MPYFYILQSQKNGRFYLGSTKNFSTRIKKHNYGEVCSTKAFRPWKLVYKEKYKTIKEARKREKQVKSWKSRYNIVKLIKKVAIV